MLCMRTKDVQSELNNTHRQIDGVAMGSPFSPIIPMFLCVIFLKKNKV